MLINVLGKEVSVNSRPLVTYSGDVVTVSVHESEKFDLSLSLMVNFLPVADERLQIDQLLREVEGDRQGKGGDTSSQVLRLLGFFRNETLDHSEELGLGDWPAARVARAAKCAGLGEV